MKFPRKMFCAGVFSLLACVRPSGAWAGENATLPATVKAEWDMGKAWREASATRERICINGLWRWQPAKTITVSSSDEIPSEDWGFYKVPACWPGIQDYMQSDYQTLYHAPAWSGADIGQLKSAWYERTIMIPAGWAGRRIGLRADYVNSYAEVFLDGKKAGVIRFPSGEADLTSVVQPGATQRLSLRVTALPLKAVMETYNDTNMRRETEGRVERRGLCGDVWLTSEPAGARVGATRVETSFRKKQIVFCARLAGLSAGASYRLSARITEGGRSVASFDSPLFTATDLQDGVEKFAANWLAPKLWDIDTPENQYDATVMLLDANGKRLDESLPERFGFREMWIEGRDFVLNGKRLHLSLVPLDNAQIGAALSTYEAARESLLRLKGFGINFVYTHNYGCEPGAHLSFAEILRAADDTGMLVALSQPHFSAYEWKNAEADETNGYARHAAFYIGVAGNHPSVVAYAMSHNATGYNEDTNPEKIDGLGAARDSWASNNVAKALRCEAIVKHLDPTRLVYHHSSGNLGEMYTLNFYPNFVPSQELDDWFGHWSSAGVKPLALVEYGAPFGWDWTMYRGWYNGQREFGGAAVPWEYCIAEWDAQFLGDTAYRISEREKANLRWEARQFREGRLWHHWEYPYPVGDARLEEVQPVQAAYTADNWRAFRTWGVSGISPWEFDRFWKLRDGFQARRRELAVDWEHLQRPGFSRDYIDRTYARFDVAYESNDWVALPAAQALYRNNRPLLGWIAGKAEHFTEKGHCFHPGETVEKQLVVINNSRQPVKCRASWEADLLAGAKGAEELTVAPGDNAFMPVTVRLPENAAPGDYQIKARFAFSTGETQEDSFALRIMPKVASPEIKETMALFDPRGETAKLLAKLGVKAKAVDAGSSLAGFDLLIIGKGALTVDGAAPSLTTVRDGLKVVVFEQTGEALEKRLGFRIEEYGLRQAWPRAADGLLLDGLNAEDLRDWRGASTLLAPTLAYTLSPRYNGAPAVQWCGLETPRLWRCGNWGNVASVLIQKPERGDFLPIIDGGYALQYSPLLEYHEGRGMILFCQMDVTGRTDEEPAAERLVKNILSYAQGWQPKPRRTAVYAGEEEGQAWLEAAGIRAATYVGQGLRSDEALVVGPSGGQKLAAHRAEVAEFLGGGGHVACLGLDESEASAFLAEKPTMRAGEHIAAWFPAPPSESPLTGVAAADVHNRDPREIPLVTGGAEVFGDGVLAVNKSVVFYQLPPFAYRETDAKHFNQRRSFERSSYALSRILGNMGVGGETPLLERFGQPVEKTSRWINGLYLLAPESWDDPYRFFGW